MFDLSEHDIDVFKKNTVGAKKIVAICDIRDWSRFRSMLENEAPDYLLIVGGVFASFHWQTKREETKKFIRQSLNPLSELDKHAWRASALSFNYLFYLMCGLKFYSAIRFAAKTCKVFVIRSGFEDESFVRLFIEEVYGKNRSAFPTFPLYDADKIGSIENCAEITGRVVDTDGLRVLGLGFDNLSRMKNLKPIIDNARKSPPDIVLARRLPPSEFRPRLEKVCSVLKPKRYVCSARTTNGVPFKFKLNDTWVIEAGRFPDFFAVVKIKANAINNVLFRSPELKSKKMLRARINDDY